MNVYIKLYLSIISEAAHLCSYLWLYGAFFFYKKIRFVSYVPFSTVRRMEFVICLCSMPGKSTQSSTTITFTILSDTFLPQLGFYRRTFFRRKGSSWRWPSQSRSTSPGQNRALGICKPELIVIVMLHPSSLSCYTIATQLFNSLWNIFFPLSWFWKLFIIKYFMCSNF